MTTAHRATWKAAHGGSGEEGSFSLHAASAAVAARDLVGQTALKNRTRASTRSSAELRRELDSRERAAKRARTVAAAMLPLRAPSDHTAMLRQNPEFSSLDADVEIGLIGPDGENGTTWSTVLALQSTEQNSFWENLRPRGERNGADQILEGGPRDFEHEGGRSQGHASGSHNDETRDNQEIGTVRGKDIEGRQDVEVRSYGRDDVDDDIEVDADDDDDDDEEEELRAELMRIRAERESEREAAEAEQIASGNPLLNLSAYAASSVDETDGESVRSTAPAEFSVRRRWDDDVVFKNQARNERALQPRFINDTIRNDFHRRFMKRYVR
jgi:protein CWC15